MARGVYKRGNIYWIRYAGPDGKMVFESSRSSNEKEAEALLHIRKAEVLKGTHSKSKASIKLTFNDLARDYLKWIERQRSLKSKRCMVKQLIAAFGDVALEDFNIKMIEQYQTERLNKGNKPATVNRFLSTISGMFAKAVDWEMVNEAVLKAIRKVKPLPENNKRLRYLSKVESKRLIECCKPELKPIVITALNTGMRRGEMLSLTWDKVDLTHGFILLDRTKNDDRREIPINQSLAAALNELTRRVDVPYVFYNPNTGDRYHDIKKGFKTACKKAEIKDFRFHDLRHTFASHLVMSGVDLATVKDLLGHKNINMTLRYAHLAPGHKAKAVKVLEGVFKD